VVNEPLLVRVSALNRPDVVQGVDRTLATRRRLRLREMALRDGR
jgi:hypothetical protein